MKRRSSFSHSVKRTDPMGILQGNRGKAVRERDMKALMVGAAVAALFVVGCDWFGKTAEALTVDGGLGTVLVGDSVWLTARTVPTDALMPDIVWSSSDPSVLRVDEAFGLSVRLSGLKAANVKVTLTAKAEGLSPIFRSYLVLPNPFIAGALIPEAPNEPLLSLNGPLTVVRGSSIRFDCVFSGTLVSLLWELDGQPLDSLSSMSIFIDSSDLSPDRHLIAATVTDDQGVARSVAVAFLVLN